ncbi:glycoside hydrolase family 9 protein [Marinimicrobium alkaliphilum]|uniref:glycoside hydrolase family 9 protein n=1 Tax=Marinimicrobium alkaliphilum TaxID=2202654 RepID=UPI000DBA2078|nr:glycoside hydrolase family 9 protein [Marinimicrobium alkaliphilum]
MSKCFTRLFLPAMTALFLSACGSSSADNGLITPPPGGSGNGASSSSSSSASGDAEGMIKVNQVGFLPEAQKLAVVPGGVEVDAFEVVTADGETVVYTGELGSAATWAPAQESVRLADFSGLSDEGSYRIRVEGLDDSPAFTVAADAYAELSAASLKAFYLNRASIELLPEYAGDYARSEGHPDDEVLVHRSAASNSRPAGFQISAAKGWYDAGDFGKYVVNSGVSTYTLLAAYEHFPAYYAAQNLNIPESVNDVPDILDEARWNIEWMLAMQDEDGGVYHKLTTLNFAGTLMPHQATATRYVIGKATSATLNFAAVMAQASRIWEAYDEDFAAEMLDAAVMAWGWAQENPEVRFTNPVYEDSPGDNVFTGEYGGNDLASNRAWAAAELFITTGEDNYYNAVNFANTQIWHPAWPDSRASAWISLATHQEHLSEVADIELINSRITNLANDFLNMHNSSAYRVAMTNGDFYWGSNANVLNRAFIFIKAYRLTGNDDYLNAAQSHLDYILGRNATDYSFVTGFGSQTPMDIHHRVSAADDNEQPVPGLVAGGANPQNMDQDCGASRYPSSAPAKAYLDDYCSYSTNEVAINWNAPLVYVTGALQALSQAQAE